MIIRSQDKKLLLVLENAYEINITQGTVYMFGSNIGEYSTEEKALSVLDMICARYQAIWDAENGFISSSNFSSIFQMPQDSEV